MLGSLKLETRDPVALPEPLALYTPAGLYTLNSDSVALPAAPLLLKLEPRNFKQRLRRFETRNLKLRQVALTVTPSPSYAHNL